jgi:hypothetical protein
MKLLVKNLFPFFILLFVVIGCQSKADHEAWQERSKVVDVLNEQFNLRNRIGEAAGLPRYDCRFQFRIFISEQSALLARLCESSSSTASISDILTPKNVALIKAAKFEKVILYDRHEDKVLAAEAIR